MPYQDFECISCFRQYLRSFVIANLFVIVDLDHMSSNTAGRIDQVSRQSSIVCVGRVNQVVRSLLSQLLLIDSRPVIEQVSYLVSRQLFVFYRYLLAMIVAATVTEQVSIQLVDIDNRDVIEQPTGLSSQCLWIDYEHAIHVHGLAIRNSYCYCIVILLIIITKRQFQW